MVIWFDQPIHYFAKSLLLIIRSEKKKKKNLDSIRVEGVRYDPTMWCSSMSLLTIFLICRTRKCVDNGIVPKPRTSQCLRQFSEYKSIGKRRGWGCNFQRKWKRQEKRWREEGRGSRVFGRNYFLLPSSVVRCSQYKVPSNYKQTIIYQP